MREFSDEDSVTLAFYGVDLTKQRLEKFCDVVIAAFAKLGCPADALVIVRNGSKSKRVRVERGRQALGIADESDLAGVTVASEMGGRYSSHGAAAVAHAWVGEGCVAVTLMKNIVDFGGDLLELANSLITSLAPQYGIGYSRSINDGPLLYAKGVIQTLDPISFDRREGLNITFWSSAIAAAIWNRGILRDVYTWNFVNPIQLGRLIDGESLETWIRKDKSRGIIDLSGSDICYWEVSPEYLKRVRTALWEAGLVFNWARDIEGAAQHPNAGDIKGP